MFQFEQELKMNSLNKLVSIALLTVANAAAAIEINSMDITEGHHMKSTFEFSSWGCKGDNLSPQLTWSNIPEGTKSLAITVYDPDAPTESGFWHWVVSDIPVTVHAIARGVDIEKLGGKQYRNDYGTNSFGGACPPKLGGMHRYQFTVWALPVATLGLNTNTPAAVVGYQLNAKAIDKARLTATYSR